MKLTAFLALALVAPAARAVVLPVDLPALSVLPSAVSAAPAVLSSRPLSAAPLSASTPMIPALIPAPALPAPSAGLPLIVPARLPGVKNPLPVPQTLQASSPLSSLDDVHLDWDFLDLDGGPAALPVTAPRPRGPKPLPPAGAAAQLKFASEGAKPGLVRVGADPLFDQARALAELGVD